MALKDSATDAVPGAVMGELAGFTIPRLGMGTMALAIEGRPDRDTAIRAIHAGLNAGVRYLDTAWSYYLPSRPGTGTPEDLGYGEKLVRDALATWDGPRDEVLVATKTGYRRTMESSVRVSDSPESDTDDSAAPRTYSAACDDDSVTPAMRSDRSAERQHL